MIGTPLNVAHHESPRKHAKKESDALHNHGNSKSLCCFCTVSQVVNYLNELLLKNTWRKTMQCITSDKSLRLYDSCTRGMLFIWILRWVEHIFFLVFPTEQLCCPFRWLWTYLFPIHTYPGMFGNGDFSSLLQRERRFRAAKMQVSKYGAQSGGFLKRHFLVYVCRTG